MTKRGTSWLSPVSRLDTGKFRIKSEKAAWIFKSTMLASFMAMWVVAPLAILIMPEKIPEALLITALTTWVITPLVSSQLINNQVQMLKEQQQLTYMAHHDGMTGLMNRTFFLQCLQELQKSCIEDGDSLGVVAVDIDHFKSINDHYGHAIGDDVIIGFPHLMCDLAPDGAVVGRTGGEEFTIGIRGNQNHVEQFVQTLCATTPKMDFAGTGATISAGFVMGTDENYVNLCIRADAALYEAKHAGRNCYRLAA